MMLPTNEDTNCAAQTEYVRDVEERYSRKHRDRRGGEYHVDAHQQAEQRQ